MNNPNGFQVQVKSLTNVSVNAGQAYGQTFTQGVTQTPGYTSAVSMVSPPQPPSMYGAPAGGFMTAQPPGMTYGPPPAPPFGGPMPPPLQGQFGQPPFGPPQQFPPFPPPPFGRSNPLTRLIIIERVYSKDSKSGKSNMSVDQATLDKLEAGFKKLQDAKDCKSLLKKYLTKEIFDKLKTRKTAMGATLLDVIQS
ncbi:hypothetical protein MTO96_036335, partial [Rhipicephalus appendiculatus]